LCVVVPTAPVSLQVFNTTEHSVFVGWQSPVAINGILKQYLVTIWITNTQDSKQEWRVPASATSTNITGLTPVTNYTIQVQTVDRQGPGCNYGIV